MTRERFIGMFVTLVTIAVLFACVVAPLVSGLTAASVIWASSPPVASANAVVAITPAATVLATATTRPTNTAVPTLKALSLTDPQAQATSAAASPTANLPTPGPIVVMVTPVASITLTATMTVTPTVLQQVFLVAHGINDPVCELETSFREGWQLCMSREIRQQASVSPGQVTLSNNTRIPSGNTLQMAMFSTETLSQAFNSRLDVLGNNDSEATWSTGYGVVTTTLYNKAFQGIAGNVVQLSQPGNPGIQSPAQQLALLRQANQVVPFAVLIRFSPPDLHNVQIQFGPTSFIDSDGPEHEGAKQDGSGSFDWQDSGWQWAPSN